MSVIVHNKLLEKIDPLKIPDHVAIIMDGNGRWARKLNKERFFGHNSGIKAVREAIDLSIELGIDTLTLYVFSMENWNRPKNEVNALMVLLFKSINKELSKLIENNIKTVKKKSPWKGMREYSVFLKDDKLVLPSVTGKQSWTLDKKSLVYRDKEWGEEKDEVIRYWKRIN